jgi:hypothetical protein
MTWHAYVKIGRLGGGGSDYSAFVQHIGVPSVDMSMGSGLLYISYWPAFIKLPSLPQNDLFFIVLLFAILFEDRFFFQIESRETTHALSLSSCWIDYTCMGEKSEHVFLDLKKNIFWNFLFHFSHLFCATCLQDMQSTIACMMTSYGWKSLEIPYSIGM